MLEVQSELHVNITCRSQERYDLIASVLPFESLIRHLQRTQATVKFKALQVMNALFLRASKAQADDIAKVHMTLI